MVYIGLKETSQTLGSAFDMEISDGQEFVVGAHDKNEDITGRTIIIIVSKNCLPTTG